MTITKYTSKRYIFRSDGNSKIGVGHIMRTLTIAMALHKQLECDDEFANLTTDDSANQSISTTCRVSDPILFICADEDSAAVVRSRGFQTHVFDTAYDHMEDELPLWEQLGIKDATILIDSYYTTDCYLEALKQYGRTVILDDLQEHTYPVDVVINYNVFANPEIYKQLYETNMPDANYIGKNIQKTKCYLGAQYVPLRDEFASFNRNQLHSNADSAIPSNVIPYTANSINAISPIKLHDEGNKHRNILITTGGGDQDNIAGKIYDTLSVYKACDSNVSKANTTTYHIVSGVFNPYFQQLKQLEQQRDDLKVYHDVQDMASLISSCDIAITAGGSTIYEICSLGVPLICFSYARNQEQLVEYIGEHVAYSAGAYDKDPANTLSTISNLINSTYNNSDALAQISNKERRLVDGKGAGRIANILRNSIE